MSESRSELRSVREILEELARRIGLQQPTETGRMFAAWAEIVGPDVAARCQPESLKDGVLRLRTDSAAWAGQIKYLGHDIAKRINHELGAEVVAEVVAFVGPKLDGASAAAAGQDRASGGHSDRSKKTASGQVQKRGSEPPLEGVAEISDDRLREATKRAHLAAKMRKKRG